MRLGRPPNLRKRMELLQQLRDHSIGEVVRDGGFTRNQVKHYVRALHRLGYIAQSRYFSYLDTDGAGAKRYELTPAGRHALSRHRARLELDSSVARSHQPPGLGSTAQPADRPPERVEVRPAGRTTRTSSSQQYVGVHNLCYSMIIMEAFTQPFKWEKEYLMGNGSWVKRHATLVKGVHIEENGGSRWDRSGTIGHTLTVKFRLNGEDPVTNERNADACALTLRALLEKSLGCTLSEPERRGLPKHSIVGDPVARAMRQAGVALHGQVGIDDSPEPATLELDSAEKVNRYLRGLDSVANLGTVVARLQGTVEAIARTQAVIAALLETNSVLLRTLVERIGLGGPSPTPPPLEPRPVDSPPPGQREGYA